MLAGRAPDVGADDDDDGGSANDVGTSGVSRIMVTEDVG
jgi:hypothetical protein